MNQLKSLFELFTQQRKALEVSISKTKKLEDEKSQWDGRNKNMEEQHKVFYKRVEQLEYEREILLMNHKKDKEGVEIELEQKRQLVKRYESELKDMNS